MATAETAQERESRWQRWIREGRGSEVLAEIDRMRQFQTGTETSALLNWEAEAANRIGEARRALRAAGKALDKCDGTTPRRTVALIYANIGLACLQLEDLEKSSAYLALAEHALRELDDSMLAAVLCNRAVSELSQNRTKLGLSLLTEAEQLASTILDGAARDSLKLTIKIDRGVFTFFNGRMREGVELLLGARRESTAVGNPTAVATIDLNLARAYERLHLFGSMLEAAKGAEDLYRRSGSRNWASTARETVIRALRHLGKDEQADRLVTEAVRSATDETDVVLPPLPEGHRVVDYSDEVASEPLSRRECDAIFQRLDELFDAEYAGNGLIESEELLRRLESSSDLGIQLQARFLRALRDAYLGRDERAISEREFADLEEYFGPRLPERIVAVTRGFAAHGSGSSASNLRAWLAISWGELASWYEQEHESHRSDFMSGRRLSHVCLALDAAIDVGAPGIVFEIIETFRMAASSSSVRWERFGLVPFASLT